MKSGLAVSSLAILIACGGSVVGPENTFVVTPQGGRSLTGKSRGLIEVF